MTGRLKSVNTCESCGRLYHPFRRSSRFCSRTCYDGVVPAERLAAIIDRVLPEFGGDPDPFHQGDQTGPLEAMCNDIVLSTGMSRDAVLRRVYDIRTGRAQRVSLGVADAILSGIGLTHLWHTELSDLKKAA